MEEEDRVTTEDTKSKHDRSESRSGSKLPVLRRPSEPPEPGPSTLPHHAYISEDEAFAMQLQKEMEEEERLAAKDERMAREFELELNQDIHRERAQRLGEGSYPHLVF